MKCSATNILGAQSVLLKRASAAIGFMALASTAQAAVHGITGPTFNLDAAAGYISQPDGAHIYSWGYGCAGGPTGYLPSQAAGTCPQMQLPGPTMIVTEGDSVTVNLKNNLPPVAGRTSIVFPGMTVTAGAGADGLLAKEAANGATVTYTFTAGKPGTYAYYSGTQPDLQIEMGLSGAIIVLPNSTSAQAAACKPKGVYSLAASAYAHKDTCYDREYLFEFAELSSKIHEQVETQVSACAAVSCPRIAVVTEPYRPNYYLVNGRSMPDDMDVAYSPSYPNQPYNGNPHMHPGENVLMRVIGQGRWQHPFHFHGNHARVLARDASLIVSQTDATKLAGPLLFTISTVSGQTVDAIFTWTGQGLNWDVYGIQPHKCNGRDLPAVPGAGSAQSAGFDPGTHEYCGDHGKPMPVTPPDPSIVVNGQWYAGTPYLGLQNAGNQTPEAPGTLNQNPQGGYAYMWHSHNEREITTNDVFPGGMMMMLLIDPYSWPIDETL
ncbi:MAG TPA: multicopper oxidase domain-containing protein [Steroidobacteraceae bacterium]|jgi:FtsP/CotA-like multicopper oxidase with cupredoxin domain